MPVMGMMSVFDWSEADNVKGGWTGREWFVVNKALAVGRWSCFPACKQAQFQPVA